MQVQYHLNFEGFKGIVGGSFVGVPLFGAAPTLRCAPYEPHLYAVMLRFLYNLNPCKHVPYAELYYRLGG